MRKLIASLHLSLDGLVAGPNGEMDWIQLDEAMFDLVGKFTNAADTALYGRVTYGIMQQYWPDAADRHHATRHDIQHSNWYNQVDKIVLSKTMRGEGLAKTTIISERVPEEIIKIKQQKGRNILIFGSPTVVRFLSSMHLIDEYWLFINPVILGHGIPVFGNNEENIKLKLEDPVRFNSGVMGLHYIRKEG